MNIFKTSYNRSGFKKEALTYVPVYLPRDKILHVRLSSIYEGSTVSKFISDVIDQHFLNNDFEPLITKIARKAFATWVMHYENDEKVTLAIFRENIGKELSSKNIPEAIVGEIIFIFNKLIANEKNEY